MCVNPHLLPTQRGANTVPQAPVFWIIARAVAEFVEDPEQGAGLLPLSGSFPDMKAESEAYVRLQNL